MVIKDARMHALAGNETLLMITVTGDRNTIATELQQATQEPDTHELIIKKQRKSRSLDANAYAWVLIDKLASKLGLTTTEVYREAIKEIPGVSDIVSVKNEAVHMLLNGWTHQGLGWQAEAFPSAIPGQTNVRLYYGSSVYDTKQMSAMIDLLVQECKLQGIETLPPQTIERMLEAADAHRN